MLAAQHFLIVCAIVLAAGTVLSALAAKTGMPDIALFLVAGIALGPAGAGWIAIGAGSTANQMILLFGASYILFDGGAATRIAVLKRVWAVRSAAPRGVVAWQRDRLDRSGRARADLSTG
jgi:cell volume regulation protein A